MFDTVISGGVIISADTRYLPLEGSVGIVDGRIDYVGEKFLKPEDGREFVDARGTIVLSGLVNGHCHGDMAFAKGLGDNLTLAEQMDLFRANSWFYDDITDEDRFYARQLTYAEALLSGTTFLMENMFWSLGELSFKAFEQIGLRGAPAEDIRYDFYKSDEFLTVDMLIKFKESAKSKGLIPVLGTLPEEEFTGERLKKTADLVEKSGCYFTSHLSETVWRHQLAIEKMGGSPVKVLDRYGLINEHYIGSHGVYMDEADISILAKKGAKLVNTPLCEMKIADGVAPVPQLLKAGVVVALGTDGAMWNNSNDIFREMKGIALVQSLHSGVRSLMSEDILDMATVNGAKLFGLEDQLGTIEVGKLADVILVEATKPHMLPLRTKQAQNVSSNLVYCATGGDVRDVFIGGRCVVRDHVLVGIDLERITANVSETSLKVAKAFEKQAT